METSLDNADTCPITNAVKPYVHLILAIEADIALTVLPFRAIASKHGVPIHTVNMVWEKMCEQEND